MVWVSGIILLAALAIFTTGKGKVIRIDRTGIAIIGGAAVAGSGLMTFNEAAACVDWRTIAILLSMMIISSGLQISGIFDLLGHHISARIKKSEFFLLAVLLLSSIMSAVCINDIVCIVLTPVVISICRKAEIPPIPHLLAIALGANLGSACSISGNPQNIMIGSLSGISFLSYMKTAALPVIISIAACYAILRIQYKNSLPQLKEKSGKAVYDRHMAIKSSLIASGTISLFCLGFDMAVVSLSAAALMLITRRVNPEKIYKHIDFNLLALFSGLFVITSGAKKSGLIDIIVSSCGQFCDMSNYFVFQTGTVILSNIVSNVPAVMLLQYFIPQSGDSSVWWSGMAYFSTCAGNLTITGSIANLIVAEKAAKEHINLDWLSYLKAGLPVTLISIIIGMLLIR